MGMLKNMGKGEYGGGGGVGNWIWGVLNIGKGGLNMRGGGYVWGGELDMGVEEHGKVGGGGGGERDTTGRQTDTYTG